MIYLVSDFNLTDSIAGGSELVDDTVIKALDLTYIRSRDYKPKKDDILVLSNISTMSQKTIDYIRDNCRYVILEHDYKIHWTRHPWRFKDSIIPKHERINYDLYKNALAVFTQTDDHEQVFLDNEVEANFISLNCSIWSEEELGRLSSLQDNKKTHKFAVIDSDNWIKNKQGAEQFCLVNKIAYELVPKLNYDSFIKKLSEFSALVFFPVARETCCRLLVEAKCMNMNVITNNNSGAFRSVWFDYSGQELIDFLINSAKRNLNVIRKFLK